MEERGKKTRRKNGGGPLMLSFIVALSLFCACAGRSPAGDSTSLSADISGYTGQPLSERQGGGSYLQTCRRRAYECTRKNTRTNACTCPAGYTAQMVSLAEGPSCDYEPCWTTYGYVCEN